MEASSAISGSAEPVDRQPPVAARERWALLALTALALALRLTSLSRSLFTDEAYSLALAQRGFGHMFALFGYEANGAPYSIVLWPLIRIFGTGEPLLRAPAVAAGVAAVPALWWASRRFVSPTAALVAAALLAINPMAVWYGQTARAYSFVVLAACVAFGALALAQERRGAANARRAWALYVAAMALLAYCDIFAAPLALPAQALIAARDGRRGLRSWLRALAAVFVCCVPLLVAAAIARSRRDALYWLPKTDRPLVELALQEFTAGFSGVTAVRWASVLLGLALVAGALFGLRRSRDREGARTLAIALCWGILPAAILLAISFVKPVFWPRYAILGVPGLCLLVAFAGERLWHRRRTVAPAIACVAAIVLAGLVADVKQRSYLQESWPPAAAWLRAERLPGQPLILDNALTLPALGYYDAAFRAADGTLVVQEWHDRPVPAGLTGFKDPGGYGAVADGPPPASTIERLADVGGGSVWMVVAEADKELQGGEVRFGAAARWAREHCRVEVREGGGVWVLRARGCS